MLDYLGFKRFFDKTLIQYGNEMITIVRKAMTTACRGLSKKDIDKIISQRWSGRLYSERVWSHMDILRKTVDKVVMDVVNEVVDKEKAIKLVQDRFAVSESSARRLINTETNYAMNQNILVKAFQDGYTHFQYKAQMDERTSEVCRNLNGKIFNLLDAEVGVNVPPVHVNCRSYITPVK